MDSQAFNRDSLKRRVEELWDQSGLPGLKDFIRIPNLSRFFDSNWETNGLLTKAANQMVEWLKRQEIKGAKVEALIEPGKTPLVFAEIEGTAPGTILFYGHLDKQPHLLPWREGLSPTEPMIEDGKLYGRGACDDGYALFGTAVSIKACQQAGLSHPRCIILIEGDEESASEDLPYYFDKLADRIGTPNVIVCLDSGCFDYNTLWVTTSLRGLVSFELKVEILSEGVHSGDASGIVPSSFRIARQLLNRIDDPLTGEANSKFQVIIPGDRYQEGLKTAEYMADSLFQKYPFLEGTLPTDTNPIRAYFNRVWKAQLSITGADGLPPTATAGNVLRPSTTLKVSLRTPPTLDAKKALEECVELLTKNVPYGAKVTLGNPDPSNGWNGPAMPQGLKDILERASQNYYSKPAMLTGEGGSIPFLSFLGDRFPTAQFIVTGVVGPQANAHGPNEFLHIDYTKSLLCCIAQFLAESSSYINN
eukprot:TRINITY_DN6563_c0_g4_i1.p2 TRINITY_DN6563_c0_g4~~TRINITY_DN6563_c0_g4_i1.p2  ORF type:complete len:476 (+),score=99.84 TRINITY_DN6563_c0_g4_i1:43-1470(+)